MLDLHFRELEQGVTGKADEEDTAYRFRVEEVRGKELGVTRQSGDTAESFSQRVQQAFTAASQSVVKGAQDLRDSATGTASRISGSAQSTLPKRWRETGGARAKQVSAADQRQACYRPSAITPCCWALSVWLLALCSGALVPQSKVRKKPR